MLTRELDGAAVTDVLPRLPQLDAEAAPPHPASWQHWIWRAERPLNLERLPS
jgi:hypothetical protein